MNAGFKAWAPAASLAGVFATMAIGLGACGGDEAKNGQEEVDAVDADTTFVPVEDTLDTSILDIPFDTANDASGDDTAVDSGGTDAIEGGGFGAACAEPNDCNSGYCVDGPDGQMCTRTCIDSCPDGYACKNISSAGSDPSFICLSIAVRLCQPCRGNGDCGLAPGDLSGNLCIAHGDDGSFCGLNCGENGWTCPSGYSCETIEGAPAGSGRQCVPAEGGACECNGAGVALGLGTDCAVSNAAGRCVGARACGDEGLGVCDALVPALETCDGTDEDCDGATDEGIAGATCAIDNSYGSCPGTTSCTGGHEACEGHEPAPESCNGLDDDCDGDTDEQAVGCRDFFLDEDEDGVGAGDPHCLCGPDAQGGYTSEDDGDCDDRDERAVPGADEKCDGADNDCDGKTDEGEAEGCENYYYDGDGDGFGTSEARCRCVPDEEAGFTTTARGDCNDDQSAVNPEARETCNGRDDDCDQFVDPEGADGCTNYAYDGDGDGWGVLTDSKCLCAPSGEYRSSRLEADCDDTNALIYSGGVELCNGKDDDCDGTADEGFGDFDGDGFANCVDPDNDNDGDPNESDCKPFDADVYGWAIEVCDTKDNDCDGATDGEGSEGCTAFYLDTDGDGFGVLADSRCLCAGTALYTAAKAGDCLDSNPTVNPDAEEICDNLDNNCDTIKDVEGTTGCTTFYLDADNDEWGVAGDSRCLCAREGQYRGTKQPDCDDGLATRNPGETEICDGVDNDCDSQTDEGSGDFDGDGTSDCVDSDDDNDGDPDTSDCAPLDASVKHGATEACNGRDDDCDAATDEEGATGCLAWYFDGDNDGYGVAANSKCQCGAAGQYSTRNNTDCNDAVGVIHPGATESCNTVDDNCDGSTDPVGSGGCTTYYLDFDNDGYGRNDSRCLCASNQVAGYKVTNALDCYDTNANAKPGQESWFTASRGDGSYDYNCDGSWSHQYSGTGSCFNLCGNASGWWGPDPGCGNTEEWLVSCYWEWPFDCGIECCPSTIIVRQACH